MCNISVITIGRNEVQRTKTCRVQSPQRSKERPEAVDVSN
jgi:hypothetical protein